MCSLMLVFNADFALIYIDYLNKKIIISKDLFGKRSLLLAFYKTGELCISSCALHFQY